MKTLYTIFIGTEYDKDGNYIPKLVSHHAIEAIQREAGLMFDGYTMGFVIGGWNNEKGIPVTEHSLRIEIVSDSDKLARARSLAQFAKELLKQNCVMLNQQAVHTEMI
jgi:hypothetical protein